MAQTVVLSDGKSIEIEMLPLRSYGEMIKAITGVFKEVMDKWEGLSNEEIMELVPDLIANHVEEAAMIVSVGSKKQLTTEELLDKRGLADFVVLFTAILAENDVEGVVNAVKKATMAFKSRKAAAAEPVPASPAPTPGQ